MFRKLFLAALAALFILSGLPACGGASPRQAASGGRLSLVATTTIVADVVRSVGGDRVEVSVLLPAGVDPHSFEPTPQDVAKVADASLVFANGAGLEEFLRPMLESAGGKEKVVYVSEGVPLLASQEVNAGEDEAAGDPHTFFDPTNIITWTANIERELSAVDPANAAAYAANAGKYRAQLEELDGWIRDQVAQVPEAGRQLVTDHAVFTYFASRYGFQQTGALSPGYSSLSQPSAQELAALEDTIRRLNVKAVFVGSTVNPALAERVTKDTNTRLVSLYTESLTGPQDPAPTYLDFMRYDVTQIVEALK